MTKRKLTKKQEQLLEDERRRQHQEKLEDAVEEAEALVGPVTRRDDVEPEQKLRPAAKRLRKYNREHDDPTARYLAEEIDELDEDENADDLDEDAADDYDDEE